MQQIQEVKGVSIDFNRTKDSPFIKTESGEKICFEKEMYFCTNHNPQHSFSDPKQFSKECVVDYQ